MEKLESITVSREVLPYIGVARWEGLRIVFIASTIPGTWYTIHLGTWNLKKTSGCCICGCRKHPRVTVTRILKREHRATQLSTHCVKPERSIGTHATRTLDWNKCAHVLFVFIPLAGSGHPGPCHAFLHGVALQANAFQLIRSGVVAGDYHTPHGSPARRWDGRQEASGRRRRGGKQLGAHVNKVVRQPRRFLRLAKHGINHGGLDASVEGTSFPLRGHVAVVRFAAVLRIHVVCSTAPGSGT